MFQADSYTEKAFKWLKHICDTRIYDKYKDNTAIAYSQMEKELSYIRKQGSAPLFKVVFEALTGVRAKPKDFCPMGALASSMISYLLDFSNIDPLESVPKLYPVFCYGMLGEKKPDIELCVSTRIYRGLVRYFNDYSAEVLILYRHFENGKILGIRIIDPQVKDEIDDYDLRFSFHPIESKKKLRKELYKGDAFEIIRPRSYEDRVRCKGLMHNAKWTWEENAKSLFTRGKVPLNMLISHREDVYEYMMDHGIGKNYSYIIAEYVGKGRPLKKGWEPDMLAAMQKAKIPLWYMESCTKIKYLFPRAHDMVFLKNFGK